MAAAIAKTQKNDTPKVVALGVVIAIIAGLLIFQVTSFVNPPDSPEATAPPAAATTTTTGTTDTTTTTTAPTGEIVIPDSPLGPDVDPFRKILRRRDEPLNVATEALPPTTGTKPDPLEGKITLPPVGKGTETRPIEVPPPVTDTVKPRLSGVLLGKRPVAVVEIGDKTFVVGVGETLPGGARVLAIYETTAVISVGKKRVTLSLDEPKQPPPDKAEPEKPASDK